MTIKFILMRDSAGECVYGYPFSDVGAQVILSPNTPQSYTVPQNVDTVVFSFSKGSDVYVNPVATAGLPGGAFAATLQDLNPVLRPVVPGQTLSFISATNAGVTLSFFKT
jgi:hypothetical protein